VRVSVRGATNNSYPWGRPSVAGPGPAWPRRIASATARRTSPGGNATENVNCVPKDTSPCTGNCEWEAILIGGDLFWTRISNKLLAVVGILLLQWPGSLPSYYGRSLTRRAEAAKWPAMEKSTRLPNVPGCDCPEPSSPPSYVGQQATRHAGGSGSSGSSSGGPSSNGSGSSGSSSSGAGSSGLPWYWVKGYEGARNATAATAGVVMPTARIGRRTTTGDRRHPVRGSHERWLLPRNG